MSMAPEWDYSPSEPLGALTGIESLDVSFDAFKGQLEMLRMGQGMNCSLLSGRASAAHSSSWHNPGALAFTATVSGVLHTRTGDLPEMRLSSHTIWITRLGAHDASYYGPREQNLRTFSIAVTPEFLLSFCDGHLPRKLLPLIEGDTDAALPILLPTPYLKHAFDGADAAPFRRMRVEAVAMLMLSNILGTMTEDVPGPAPDNDALLRLARDLLLEDLSSPPTVTELSEMLGLSPWQLSRGFKRLFGHTPQRLLLEARMEVARDMLHDRALPLKAIAWAVGYAHVNNFITAYTRLFGAPPRQHVRDEK